MERDARSASQLGGSGIEQMSWRFVRSTRMGFHERIMSTSVVRAIWVKTATVQLGSAVSRFWCELTEWVIDVSVLMDRTKRSLAPAPKHQAVGAVDAGKQWGLCPIPSPASNILPRQSNLHYTSTADVRAIDRTRSSVEVTAVVASHCHWSEESCRVKGTRVSADEGIKAERSLLKPFECNDGLNA